MGALFDVFQTLHDTLKEFLEGPNSEAVVTLMGRKVRFAFHHTDLNGDQPTEFYGVVAGLSLQGDTLLLSLSPETIGGVKISHIKCDLKTDVSEMKVWLNDQWVLIEGKLGLA